MSTWREGDKTRGEKKVKEKEVQVVHESRKMQGSEREVKDGRIMEKKKGQVKEGRRKEEILEEKIRQKKV